MHDELQTLRAAVANERLPLQQRTDAARYAVRLQLESVPVPSADDPEVISESQTFDDPLVARFAAVATSAEPDTRKRVHGWRKDRVLYAIVVDRDLHRLERLAACAVILDTAPYGQHWKINHYSAERLLDTVCADDATRLEAGGKRVKVNRPPQWGCDLWPK